MAGSVQMRELTKDKKILIAPSLLSCDVLNMARHIEALGGCEDWLHLDVMDGHFVPNLSYGPSLLAALRKRYPKAFIDVHIMVSPAEDFVDMFLAKEPSLLTVHAEATSHIHRVLQKIKTAGVFCGVAINPGTPVSLITPVLDMTDLVLVMSVNPGYGGQSFIPSVLDKVKELVRIREDRGAKFLIEMDGGIGPLNAALVSECGCDVAVAGSAVFGQPDPCAVIKAMKSAAEGKIA